MEPRRTRGKKIKYDDEQPVETGEASDSNDLESLEHLRKSRIRDSNKEYARRMTILQTWSEYWTDYTTREGDAYPKKEALNILKRSKKILCPIETCRKAFTTFGGLRYHYARCNIERCFKCKVCNPIYEVKTKGDLLRHMIRSHHKEMPPLNDEQNEIANSYLVGSGRADKRGNANDHETQMNCRHIVKSYYDMVEKNFEPTNFSKRPYKDWQLLCKDWELITLETDRLRYIPPERESPYIKMTETSWYTLKAGESAVLKSKYTESMSQTAQNDSSGNVIFFTGGMCTSSAWSSKPLVDRIADLTPELLALSVNCCPMDKNFCYRDCKDTNGCLQFWAIQASTSVSASCNDRTNSLMQIAKPELAFMVGHGWGNIFEMSWCPLGASWEPPIQFITELKENSRMPRVGLLAIACGDGQIRLISVPHMSSLLLKSSDSAHQSEHPIEKVPIFRVKPVACLSAPGVGQSTDCQIPACTSICWNLEDNQRLLAAGYSNGSVALFDLANYSPILYSTVEHYHIYRPYKTWFAHGLPVLGIALLSSQADRTFVATGGRDRHLKIWNPLDLHICLVSDRSPITRIIWDYRFRGIVSSTEAAFTSFQNRVSYRYPTTDGAYTNITIATHRATVWGLANSIITSSLATCDEAGEVLVAIYGRPIQKKDRNLLSTHCVYNVLPQARRTPVTSATDGAACNGPSNNQNDSTEAYSTMIEAHNSLSTQLPSATQQTTNGAQLVTISNDQLITTMQPAAVGAETMDNLEVELDENNEEDIYGHVERTVANKPARFLLPIDYPAVETYKDFKQNFGLEYSEYDQTYPRSDQKFPESCLRANDVSKIYCDRVCDYPFCSIKSVSFSPNTSSFAYLLSVSHIGLCRVDKIAMVETMYKHQVETLGSSFLLKYARS